MSTDVRLHRMFRRGTSYGPVLPEGVFEDDGADRGIIFVFVGAHPGRQAADPPAREEPAAVRDHPWRGVLLRPGYPGLALAS